MSKLEVLLYGFLIALVIILIWLVYAYYYRTSMTRLAKLAGQKYMIIAPAYVQAQYIIQCDPTTSSFNSTTNSFNAVIKFTPDIDHPNAPPLPNVIKNYTITYDSSTCDPSKLVEYINCIDVNG
jgi:glucan phosphoethanolaminetransferase (alkaline phosphatase superfamily)